MRDIRLGASLPNLVGKLFRRMAREHNAALKPLKLSALHANVLGALWLEGPLTPGELQDLLALGSSTLTGAIDRMEKAGLVRRVPDPEDRRSVRVEPAGALAKKKEAVLARLVEAEQAFFAPLTADERGELARLLEKVLAAPEGN